MPRSYDDAMDMGYEHAKALISRGLDALGVSDTIPGLSLDYGTNGTILLTRIREAPHGNPPRTRCPCDNLVCTGDPAAPLELGALQAIDVAIRRHARRTLRIQAMRKAGVSGDPPPWSYTMHRLTLAWLRHKEMDPLLVRDGPNRMGINAFNYIAEEHGLSGINPLVEDGRIEIPLIEERKTGMQIIGHGIPCLVIETVLPQTLVAAITGKLLSDIVDHPAIRRAGPIRIVGADQNQEILTLMLSDVQDFIRRPPPGFDRRWNRIPFTPRTWDD